MENENELVQAVLEAAREKPWVCGPYYRSTFLSPSQSPNEIGQCGFHPQGEVNAAAIVRAVNTFAQAREALRAMLHVFDRPHNVDQGNYDAIMSARAALAVMEQS